MRTLIHLVRHAEVENPHGIWYGRLEGFPLSRRGREQAGRLGEHFADREIQAVYTSPLARARETAAAIASIHGFDPKEEPDIIESETRLEGLPGSLRLFLNPFRLRHFLNPFRPSWGEPYDGVRLRMSRAIEAMAERHDGGEAVAVSHMTPILVARLFYEESPHPPWRAGRPCARASVTTLTFEDGEFAGSEYLEPG